MSAIADTRVRGGHLVWEDTNFSIYNPWSNEPRQDGFSLEVEEAKGILRNLNDHKIAVQDMQRKAAQLVTMKPPSEDPATVAANVALVGDGQGQLGAYSHGAEAIDAQLAYITELADRIQKALDAIGESEQDQTKTMKNVDPDAEPPGKL
ncbi:hypothetical protein [Amycolatopsis jiangsuensis]|uniref:PE family protein n=1 Tax=Amycolatopsis jiangsuensis TaxID=1181879 RepID=A0A840J7Z7_9PSEU|nr:hypothetical protein [Amycolatopsis jiangsuensis]MBB4689839.1 hypothetical protein [Amycolatopsis jiangsuensis]